MNDGHVSSCVNVLYCSNAGCCTGSEEDQRDDVDTNEFEDRYDASW